MTDWKEITPTSPKASTDPILVGRAASAGTEWVAVGFCFDDGDVCVLTLAGMQPGVDMTHWADMPDAPE